jgi:hypothetical protein
LMMNISYVNNFFVSGHMVYSSVFVFFDDEYFICKLFVFKSIPVFYRI